MNKPIRLLLIAPCLLAGCAANKENLLFAETTDVGIAFHPAPTTGLQFTVGVKMRDLAVVPVAALDGQQNLQQRRAVSPDHSEDAVSVFAQFSAQSAPPDENSGSVVRRRVSLGRFFSTGVAAVNLAEGYKEGWSGGTPVTPATKPASATAKPPRSPQTPVGGAPPTGSAPGPDADALEPIKVMKPLIFGQYDSYGLDIGTALDANGVNFSLGYAGRNLAIMPLFGETRGGRLKALGSEGPSSNPDAYSVLGQFRADAATTSADLRLDRFFSTGLAAQRLSEGLGARIASDLKNPKTAAEATGK